MSDSSTRPERSILDVVDNAAVALGSRPFLRAPDGTASFEQFQRSVLGWSVSLARVGASDGTRVLLVAPAGIRFLALWAATMATGAIPVALNVASKPREIGYAAMDTGASHAIIDEAHRDLAEGIPDGTAVFGLDWRPERGTALAFSPSRTGRFASTAGHRYASIVYTSGTSGLPKGVIVSHQAYVWAGEAFCAWLGLERGDHLWTSLPFHHVNAQAYSFMGALCGGHPLTITPRFHASTFWQDAADVGATTTNLVGGMLHYVNRQPAQLWRPHKLRRLYAAPAGSPETRGAFETANKTSLITGYALSECFFGCIEDIGQPPMDMCVGKPRRHPDFENEMAIVDPQGVALPDGADGEIVMRNPAVTPGYWNAPELTGEQIRDGWLHSGDTGCRDASGNFFLKGRLKEMMRRKGENIAPREIETVLGEHPAVREAAVVGIPSTVLRGEEDVCAFVITDTACDAEALRRWCAERLSAFKLPDQIVFVSDFPRTATMRVAKHELVNLIRHGATHA